MASYKLVFTKNAAKDISKLPDPISKRLSKKLLYFAALPDPIVNAKRLNDSATAQYRWRIGDYRVLFDVNDADIVILRVRHRKEAYKK